MALGLLGTPWVREPAAMAALMPAEALVKAGRRRRLALALELLRRGPWPWPSPLVPRLPQPCQPSLTQRPLTLTPAALCPEWTAHSGPAEPVAVRLSSCSVAPYVATLPGERRNAAASQSILARKGASPLA